MLWNHFSLFFSPHITKSPWYWLPVLKFLFVSSKLSTSKFHSLIENIFVPFFFFPLKICWIIVILNDLFLIMSLKFILFTSPIRKVYSAHNSASYTKCHPVFPVILAFHIFSIFIILYKLYFILLYYIIYIILLLHYSIYYIIILKVSHHKDTFCFIFHFYLCNFNVCNISYHH